MLLNSVGCSVLAQAPQLTPAHLGVDTASPRHLEVAQAGCPVWGGLWSVNRGAEPWARLGAGRLEALCSGHGEAVGLGDPPVLYSGPGCPPQPLLQAGLCLAVGPPWL